MRSGPAEATAIVGMALALPGCGGDPDAFAKLLDRGVDMVAPPPEGRRSDSGVPAGAALAECALLDRIDLFDHAFFGLSLREAQQMDPQQRALLELSCRAIWDSGYALADLKGAQAAVVFGAAPVTYDRLIDPAEAPLATGLLAAAQAGRVSHLLDLHGPAVIVDTACSSSLSAVHDACSRLAAGDVDWALAGGVRLMCTMPAAKRPGTEGILSPSGRARSFDAAADGTGLGEGGAVFLLKRLADARRDGDSIHAVILGGAMNQDGGRSVGFTAPSLAAQEDVLVAAWRAAGVEPGTIGFVEAHGTGTRLGDPIEFEALTRAFARHGEHRPFCVLSSSKSNLGHLDTAAGAAGLSKAVAAVKNARRYASAHFKSANPMLETEHSAILLSPSTESWQQAEGRRAGVSSFGLSGTNVHLVIEQAPARGERPAQSPAAEVLVPLSARSEAALRRHAARLACFLNDRRDDAQAFADLAWVQARGRDVERWRACVRGRDGAEVSAALEEIASGGGEVNFAPDAASTILLVPHGEGIAVPEPWGRSFAAAAADPDLAGADPAGSLAAQLGIVRLLVAAGIGDDFAIGHGTGNLLLDLLRGDADAAAAASQLAVPTMPRPPERGRLQQAIADIAAAGDPLVVAPWGGALTDMAADLAPACRGSLIALDLNAPEPRTALLDALADAFRAGANLDWPRTTALLGGYGGRAAIPAELFAPVRCWVDRPVVAASSPAAAGAEPEPEPERAPDRLSESEGTAAEIKLAAIWCDVLGASQVSLDDDFFDLGGNSLMQTQLDNAVMRDFGVKMAIDDIYDYPTLSAMAAHLEHLTREAPPPASQEAQPSHDPARTSAPASHSQRRMWVLQQLDPTSGAYNVSVRFELQGPVDPALLRRALDDLSARHGILRTRLLLEDGELVQRIEPSRAFGFAVAESGGGPGELERLLRDNAALPFDLAEPGAARALLVTDAGAARAWFQLTLHHGICDEWSMHLLLDELAAAYAAAQGGAVPPPPPRLQYADWSSWERQLQQSPSWEAEELYWREQLNGAPLQLMLPTDFRRGPKQDYRGAWLDLEIPADLVARLRKAARSRDGTLFTWMMTAYAAWLARLCQAEDMLIGVPVAGRHHVAAEAIPGCFINTLPIRIDAHGDPSFETLFSRVRSTLNAAYAHQRYPFDLMVEQLGAAGDPSRPPLVQTLLSLQGARASGERRLGEARLNPLELDGGVSWLDLSAVLRESDDGRVSGIFAYRTALFEEATVRGFWKDWLALAEAGVERPEESIHALLCEPAW